jgi:outer membrane murein-binding lipoprotein Lpp
LEDIQRVRGVSTQVFNKWVPFLRVQSEETPAASENNPAPELIVELPSVDPAGLPLQNLEADDPKHVSGISQEKPGLDEAAPIAAKGPSISPNNSLGLNHLSQQLVQRLGQSPPLTRLEAVLWGTVTALVVFFLAIVVSLGLLAGINGGLSFVPSARYAELSGQVNTIVLQLKQLQTDTSSLQERMNTLEGLSGRVAVIEKGNKDIKDQIILDQQKIQSLIDQTQQLESQINSLNERNQAFETFFAGLKTLADSVVPKNTP